MIQNSLCSSSLDLSTADCDSEFPVIKTLKWGLKIEQLPLLSSLSGSIRSTDTMVWTRQCFSNGNNAFKCGWTFYIHGFNIIRSFLRLPRHTSIRPGTPELWLIVLFCVELVPTLFLCLIDHRCFFSGDSLSMTLSSCTCNQMCYPGFWAVSWSHHSFPV